MTPFTRPLALDFWAQVDRTAGPDACWPWLGTIGKDGYGRVYALPPRGSSRGSAPAHRHAYERLAGLLAPGEDVHHECSTKSCCNPRHLIPMTRAAHKARHRVLDGWQGLLNVDLASDPRMTNADLCLREVVA